MPLFDSLLAQASAAVTGKSVTQTEQKGDYAWSSLPLDTYFPQINIKGDNWDQLFPYRFLVVDAANNNQIVKASSTPVITSRSILDSAQINVEYGNLWEARLPITPQQLNLTTLPAITNTPGLRGILEEHGGVRYKMISLTCSTGIYPARKSFDAPQQESSLGSIFAGTISNFNALSATVKATMDSIKGGSYSSPSDLQIDPKQTGYYHAMYIDQFIEQYALAKKRPECRSWRLVFDIPKQNASYYVTPGPFSLIQNVNKPMEWQWTIQLKAWKRVELNKALSKRPGASLPLTLSGYQKIVNLIGNARLAVQQSINTVKAVRSDVLGVVNNLRQVSLLVKDTATLALTAADLPRQLAEDMKSGIADTLLESNFSTTSAFDKQRVASVKAVKQQNENLSLSQVQSKAQGTAAKSLSDASPAYNMFANPETAFSIFNELQLDSVIMSQRQSQALETELNTVRSFTVQDIKNKRADLYSLYLDLSNKLGTNSALVNDIYNRPAPSSRPYPLSLDESQLLYALFDAIQAHDALTASRELDTSRVLSPMKFVQELAESYDITIEANPSKILMPVPFGLTIEQIALRYLGEANRWIEISTINALRAPYIDEAGFVRTLLSNADGRQFTIASAENLFVGQKIILSSNTVSSFTRKITNLEKINNYSYLITVDGLADLDDLTSFDKAQMKAYLPGTVNSQDMIFIPTTVPALPDLSPTITSGIPRDSLAMMTKVDFLLDDNMDVALDGNGDFRFAAGMTNLIQALKIKFLTKKGDILSHPDFGLSIKPGMSLAEIDNNQLFNEINSLILQDVRFNRLARLTIELDGPEMRITLLVIPQGDSGVVPITFVLPK